MSACEKGEQWERAVSILQVLLGWAAELGEVAFNAAICSCETTGRWQVALALLSSVSSQLEASVNSYSVALSACKDFRWRSALSLYASMSSKRLEPSLIACNAALSSCARGRQPQLALGLYRSRPSGTSEVTFNALAECAECDTQILPWILQELHDHRFQMTMVTYNLVLRSCQTPGSMCRLCFPPSPIKIRHSEGSRVANFVRLFLVDDFLFSHSMP